MYNIVRLSTRFLCVILSTFVPKQKKVWVFGAWFGNRIADNPKHFLNYLQNTQAEKILPIWIYKEKSVSVSAANLNIRAYSSTSFKGIYYQLIAKVVFVSHSISADLNPSVIGWTTKRIQMWHGVPLKKIMYDNSAENIWWKRNKIYRVLTNNFYDYILSPSPLFDEIFSRAFDMPLSTLISTGYPRNDFLIASENTGSSDSLFNVIYMPTYRSNIEKRDFLFGDALAFDVETLQGRFEEYGISLTIRVHPANSPSTELLDKINLSKNIHISSVDDIYDKIGMFDCLVTDYSSIMFDFALTGKPIVFSAFDLDSYLNEERGLYHNYEEIAEGQEVYNWTELVSKLITIKREHMINLNGGLLLELKKSLDSNEKKCYSKKLFNKISAIIKLD